MISQRSGRRREGYRGKLVVMEEAPSPTPRQEVPVVESPATPDAAEWQHRLPTLTGDLVVLREVRSSDAAALFATLTTDEVSRFIAQPPTHVEGFERFITWSTRQRAQGESVCFAVTLKGFDTAIGLFQVRQLEPGFSTAEWGFALGTAFWGTGIFEDAAKVVLEFVFDTLNALRLEARSDVENGRGNGALLKLGAVREGLLRKSFVRAGQRHNQAMYAILDEDWRVARTVVRQTQSAKVH